MSHDRTDWPHDKCVEISDAVCLSKTAHEDHVAGFLFCHDVPGYERRCIGGFNIDPHFNPVWDATGSLDDGTLTVSPSIRCVEHDPGPNAHGWVRDGKWVAA